MIVRTALEICLLGKVMGKKLFSYGSWRVNELMSLLFSYEYSYCYRKFLFSCKQFAEAADFTMHCHVETSPFLNE